VSLGLRHALVAALVAAAALVLATPALACVRVDEPMSKRLDASDEAVVGTIVSRRPTEIRGAPAALLTIDVEQKIKGWHVDNPVVAKSPVHTDCDVRIANGVRRGFLLTKAPDGTLLLNGAGVVAATPLIAAGGEPRGGVIKVVIGFFILGIVLLWALRRLRRGARPELPGAPRPR
jgi:hypothetical protein